MLRIVLTGDTLSLEGMLGREEAGRFSSSTSREM